MSTAPRNTATTEGMFEVASQAFWGSPEAGNAILKQEADGQRSFTASSTLPAQMGRNDRKVLEQAGVVFGEEVSGDKMFIYVTLPDGWKKVATDHNMWSNLVDEKGRKRASMFYKAEFYDRSAFLETNRRFGISADYEHSQEGLIVMFVTDGDIKVFTTREYSYTGLKYAQDYDTKEGVASKEASTWLDERYPNWEDASEYWR